MRAKPIVAAMALLVLGAIGGALLSPPPADAVSREIIQIQQQVAQLVQGQQDLRSSMDAHFASLQTLLQQSLDSVNHLSTTMGALQKTVQDAQANTGSRMDTMAQQVQGISDNLQDLQARVAKLSQQLSGVQSTMQSIDAKVSTGAGPGANSGASAAPGMNPAANPPVPDGSAASASNQPAGANLPPVTPDVLYSDAYRDLTTGHYDLSRQEFSDYLKYFPTSDLASNAQFYLGQISFDRRDYKGAIASFDRVIVNYPKSYKMGAAMLEKGLALNHIGQRAAALREFREVTRRFPGTEEAKKAQVEVRRLTAR